MWILRQLALIYRGSIEASDIARLYKKLNFRNKNVCNLKCNDRKLKDYTNTIIYIPIYEDNIGHLEVCLGGFELVRAIENLDKMFCGTKLVEFLQGKPLNLVFPMKIEDRRSHVKVREALLLRFNL